MLPKNIVEEKLMNRSIGTIKQIVYDNARGSHINVMLPVYVAIDFPESTLN